MLTNSATLTASILYHYPHYCKNEFILHMPDGIGEGGSAEEILKIGSSSLLLVQYLNAPTTILH